jgi:hypothetical protein
LSIGITSNAAMNVPAQHASREYSMGRFSVDAIMNGRPL